jgi:ADP-heptose:LPS heptosyltransferase
MNKIIRRYKSYRFNNTCVKFLYLIISIFDEIIFTIINSIYSNQIQSPTRIKNVAIFCPAHYGDFILSLAAFREAIKSINCNECSFTFIIASWNKDISEYLCSDLSIQFKFLDHPLTDRRHSLSKKLFYNFYHYYKRINFLKSNFYDAILFPYSYRPSLSREAYKAKIPFRMGYISSCNDYFLTHSLDHLVIQDDNLGGEFLLQYHLFLFGLDAINKINYSTENQLLPKYKNTNFNFNASSANDSAYWIIHSSASVSSKDMSIESIFEICSVALQLNKKILFTGQRLDSIVLDSCDNKNIISMVGKTNLRELIALIKNSELIFSTDTISAHIAAYFSIPQIILKEYFQINFIPIYGNYLMISKSKITIELKKIFY